MGEWGIREKRKGRDGLTVRGVNSIRWPDFSHSTTPSASLRASSFAFGSARNDRKIGGLKANLYFIIDLVNDYDKETC